MQVKAKICHKLLFYSRYFILSLVSSTGLFMDQLTILRAQ